MARPYRAWWRALTVVSALWLATVSLAIDPLNSGDDTYVFGEEETAARLQHKPCYDVVDRIGDVILSNKEARRMMHAAGGTGVLVLDSKADDKGGEVKCQFGMSFLEQAVVPTFWAKPSDGPSVFKQLFGLIGKCLEAIHYSSVPLKFLRLDNDLSTSTTTEVHPEKAGAISATVGDQRLECVLAPIESWVKGRVEEHSSPWGAASKSKQYIGAMMYTCDASNVRRVFESTPPSEDDQYWQAAQAMNGLKVEEREVMSRDRLRELPDGTFVNDDDVVRLKGRDRAVVSEFLQTGTVAPEQCMIGDDDSYDDNTVYTLALYLHILMGPKLSGAFTLNAETGEKMYLPFLQGSDLALRLRTTMDELNDYFKPHGIRFELVGVGTFHPRNIGETLSKDSDINSPQSALIKMMGLDPGQIVNVYLHDAMPSMSKPTHGLYDIVGLSTFPFKYYVGKNKDATKDDDFNMVFDPTADNVLDKIRVDTPRNLRGEVMLGYHNVKPEFESIGFEHDHFMQGVYVAHLHAETLAHELGHYLGLLHPFTGGCDGMLSDCVDDTPSAPSTNHMMALECGQAPSCPGQKSPDLRNIMNYSSCPDNERFFTAGQGERMRRALQFIRKGVRLEALETFNGKKVGQMQKEVLECVKNCQNSAHDWFVSHGYTDERFTWELREGAAVGHDVTIARGDVYEVQESDDNSM